MGMNLKNEIRGLIDVLTIKSETRPNNQTILTGFTELDALLEGLRMGELIIIGGRPGMGKTQFLINLSQSISVKFPVLYFTYDLSPHLLTNRFTSTFSGVPSSNLLNHQLTNAHMEKLVSVEDKLAGSNIFINNNYKDSIALFRSYCEEMIKENGVKVIMVDCIQEMGSTKYHADRDVEINTFGNELKGIANDLNVCIVVASQLDRTVEYREYRSGIPQLSDLQDGGGLEQDADKILLIYRPGYYNIIEDENGNKLEGLTFIDVAKNRNGNLGSITLSRDAEFTTFMDFQGYKRL